MPINNTKDNKDLRSEEVKEVLATRPKLSILFGNSFIVLLLCSFLIFLNLHRVSTNITLGFRAQDLVQNNIGTYDLPLLMTSPIPVTTKSIKQVKVVFLVNNGQVTKEIETNLKSIDSPNNIITIVVSANNLSEIFRKDIKFDKATKGLFGTLKIPTDSVSLYRLFINKMAAQNEFLINKKH